ncbi:MAG TPA: SGNH/GDSL hydrolase family protein [Humisphaera sp.]
MSRTRPTPGAAAVVNPNTSAAMKNLGLAFALTGLLLAALPSASTAAVVPTTDPNVRAGLSPYNWIVRDGGVSSSVCGASLTVRFRGTKHVAVRLDSPMAARKDPARIPVVAWSVNGGEVRTHQCGLDEKRLVLADGVQDPVVDLYIKGMSPSERRWDTDVPVNSLKVLGFEVDDGGTAAPTEMPAAIWLNVGDSILSGDGALQGEKTGRPKVWATTGDARASYGYLLARHYGHRESRLAFGGYNWTGGMARVPALTTLIDQHAETISRLTDGRLTPAPAVVLVNLGANGVPPEADVVAALTKLRARAGRDARLIVMVPTGGQARDAIARAFATYKAASGDGAAHLVDLGAIKFATCDGLHPTTAGHEEIFRAAVPAFDAILGRAAPR